MAKVENTQVFGLDESIFRSGYPMLIRAPSEDEFTHGVAEIKNARLGGDYANTHIQRAIRLANAKGGGHDQFLTGITVTMDVTVSNKCWVAIERYKFLNYVSSMSSMHRISYFDIRDCCNEYVDEDQILTSERLKEEYLSVAGTGTPEQKKKAYLDLLYNIPSGFELMAGMVTNYRCLKNIYSQRKTHRLPDWHVVCSWIQDLPLGKELICHQ